MLRLNLKDLIISMSLLPSEEEVEKFGEWAFGNDLLSFKDPENFVSAWNSRHRDILYLNLSGTITEDLKEMTALYKKNMNIVQ